MRSQLALALVFTVALLAMPSHAEVQRRNVRAKKAALTSKLRNLRAQKKVLQQKLHANKAQTHQTLAEINQVDQQIGQVEESLEQTTEQLGESRVKQKQVAGELQSATAKLAVVRKEVLQRIRRIYESGKPSSLTVLVGSRTGGEIASRTDMLSQIARSDRKIFEEYRELHAEVADRKRAQDQIVKQISTLADRQKAQAAQLQDVKAEKKQKVKQLVAQAGELEEAIAQFEQDEAQIRSQIAAFEARMRSAVGVKLPPFVGGFARPCNAPITSGFGMRFHPILHRTRLHAGIDFGAPSGTPVHAAASGIVIASQYMRGFGNTVMIAHGSNLSTVYGHLSRYSVRAGQRVEKGQVIGAVGATGLATGPHLHFEVHVNGRAVNPLGRI